MLPPPYITEQRSLFVSRGKVHDPILAALRPRLERFLSSRTMLEAARRRFALTQGRLEGVAGGFEAKQVLEQLMSEQSTRAPQRVPHYVRRVELPQHDVHPIRQYYEMPAKIGHIRTHILRTMTMEERERVIFFGLSEMAEEGRLQRIFKKHAQRWIFLLPLPHGEETYR